MIKSSDPVNYHSNLKRVRSKSSGLCFLTQHFFSFIQLMPEMTYTFDLPPGLPRPSVLLQTPILAELFGAGFTKAPRCTVRFSLITNP
jgi:hypothetical protein